MAAGDSSVRARFAAGELDSGQAASAFGRPVAVELPRLEWFRLLGILHAYHDRGELPWLDRLADTIEEKMI